MVLASSTCKKMRQAFNRDFIYIELAKRDHLFLPSEGEKFGTWKEYFLYLKQLRLNAIFEDIDEVGKYLCDDEGSFKVCDTLDMEFPIREYLVPLLIELVVKEITGAAYKPEDTKNNASDDLTKVVQK